MLSPQEYSQIVDSGMPAAHHVFTALGGLVGGTIMWRDAHPWPIPSRQRKALFAAVSLGALAGCALPSYFVGGIVQFRAETLIVGPKTILGGVLLSYVVAVFYKKLVGIAHDTSDAFARGTAYLMTIGRLGCHFQHCCFGVTCSSAWWAVDLGDGRPRIPVQLLEFAGLTALLIVIERLHRDSRMEGRRLFVFYAGYGILRFLLEFLREPVAGTFLGVGAYQWLALALAAIGIVQLLRRSGSDEVPE